MPNQKSVVLLSLAETTNNLGLKSIHSYLKSQGHRSQLLFYTCEDSSCIRSVAEFVDSTGAEVVGLSFMSRYLPLAVELTAALRGHCSTRPIIVWGGIHATIDPGSARGNADYVCVGEGEFAFSGFLDELKGRDKVANVPGINFTGSPHITSAPRITNLDDLPFSQYLPPDSWITHAGRIQALTPQLLAATNRYGGVYLPIMSSRGCPFACTYCCNNLLHKVYGKKITRKSPDNVVSEIRMNLAEAGTEFQYVDVYDDCFTAHSTNWLRRFVDQYKQIGIPLFIRAIPRFISPEKIAIMKDAPLGFVQVGIQSGSQRTLRDIYNRKQTQENLLMCANTLHENGIPGAYDVIINNPYETQRDVEETIGLVARLPKSASLALATLTFYRHTALYEKAKQDGYPVDEHLTKNQNAWSKADPEALALKTALFMGVGPAKSIFAKSSPLQKAKLGLMRILVLQVLEPLRHLGQLYLSCGKDIPRFVKRLRSHSADYAKRLFSFSKINKHRN